VQRLSYSNQARRQGAGHIGRTISDLRQAELDFSTPVWDYCLEWCSALSPGPSTATLHIHSMSRRKAQQNKEWTSLRCAGVFWALRPSLRSPGGVRFTPLARNPSTA